MKKISTVVCLIAAILLATNAFAQKMKIGDPTKNDGKVEWIPMQIETGDIPFGIPLEKFYEVKNISQEDLVILEVKSGCHCTVVDWTKAPIPPGQSGKIRITFDALKVGEFYKIISVATNFDPEISIALSMIGKVLEKPESGQ